MIGIFPDDGLQAPVGQEVVFTFSQMQGNVGSARGFFDVFDREIAFTCGFPAYGFIGSQTGAAGFNRNFVRDDETGVKTDTELADQCVVFFSGRSTGGR